MEGVRRPLICADAIRGGGVWQSSCSCRTGSSLPRATTFPGAPDDNPDAAQASRDAVSTDDPVPRAADPLPW